MLPRESKQDRGTEALHHPTKRGTQQDQPPRWCQPIGNGSPQGNEGKGRQQAKEPEQVRNERKGRQRSGATTSPQAHKERDTPPYCKEQAVIPPHHKFAPKNQQKVALGSFEKIFGKIFRGNVSGERKTPCVSQRKGVQLNYGKSNSMM